MVYITTVKGMFDFIALHNRTDEERKIELESAGVAFLFAIGVFTPGLFIIDDVVARFFLFYMAGILFATTITVLARTYIAKGNSSIVKKALIYIPSAVLIALFCPLYYFARFLEWTGITSISKHTLIFAVGILSAFAAALIVVLSLTGFILIIPNSNTMTILMTAVFIFGREAMILTVFIGFKFCLRNEKARIAKGMSRFLTDAEAKQAIDIDRHDMKKELAMIIYAVIAIGTAIIYFVDFEAIYPDSKIVKDINDSILYAFSLYTAFDAVTGKWKERKGIN